MGADSFSHDSPTPSIQQLLQHHLNFPDSLSTVDDRSVIIDKKEEELDANSSAALSPQESISDSSPSHIPLATYGSNKLVQWQTIFRVSSALEIRENEGDSG